MSHHDVIVVGTGLAGASAAATLGALGYKVHCFTFHDSARRAHSIARRPPYTPTRCTPPNALAAPRSACATAGHWLEVTSKSTDR